MLSTDLVSSTILFCIVFELFFAKLLKGRTASKQSSQGTNFTFYLLIFFAAAIAKLGYDSMNLPRNFYSILEIGRHDNIFEIRRSYKSLSKIYHPDKNSAENAADVFQIIKTSYDVLTDESLRDVYNRFGPENLEFDPRRDELKVIVDLLSTYAFWTVVALLCTSQSGSKGCRTWIVFIGIVVMAIEISFKLTEVSIPEWLPKTMTEFELIYLLHSIFPAVILGLRIWAEAYFVDINSASLQVLTEVTAHQKNMSTLLQEFEALIDSTRTNLNESNQNAQLSSVREKIISIRDEMEKNDIRYSQTIQELKVSSSSFGSNYYWLVFVLIYGGIYFLK